MDANNSHEPHGEEKKHEKQGKKKPRKAVIIFSILFILAVMFIAIYGKGLPSQEQAGLTPNPGQSPDTIQSDLSKTYAGPLFSFNYPSSWKEQLFTIKGGGNGVTIRPNSTSSTEYFPEFHMEVTPINPQKTMQDRIQNLTWMNLEQTDTVVQGIPAIKLSGIVPLRMPNGQPLDPPIYKTYLFFEKAGYLYIISYAYFQDDQEATKQSFFEDILNSVKIEEGAI